MDRANPDAIRLQPYDGEQYDDAPRTPAAPGYPVVFLEAFHLERIGANPITHTQAASIYLGARSSSKQRVRNVWHYAPEWVAFDKASALALMEAQYRPGYLVRVFHLPVLAAYTRDHVLIAAELDSDEPFRGLARPDSWEGTVKFAPATLAAAAAQMSAAGSGRPASPFLALVSRADFAADWCLAPPAPAYTVLTRRSVRSVAARTPNSRTPTIVGPEWLQRSLNITARNLLLLAG